MEYEVIEAPVPVVNVEGEIDHSNAGVLEAAVLDLVGRGHTRFILDFSKVSYLDSGGVAVIVLALQKVAPAGGLVGLAVKDENVRRILEIAGLASQTHLLKLVEERETARLAIEGDLL